MNILGTAGIPALSGDKVAAVLPLDAILAAVAVAVAHIAAVIGPEGVVIAVVGASLGAGDRALRKLDKSGVVAGRSEGRDGREGEDEKRECNHFACLQRCHCKLQLDVADR